MNWRQSAACREVGPEPFFAYEESRSTTWAKASVQAAKQVCFGCPVRDDCLNEALEMNERYGIFGGLTAEERRELLRKVA